MPVLIDIVLGMLGELRAASGPDLHIQVLDQLSSNPLISVEEDERRVRLAVAELARDLEHARVEAAPDSIRAGVRRWIEDRPVTDRAAATEGIAVLRWGGPGNRDLGWQVAVRRGDRVAAWSPSPLASAGDITATRASAQVRSLAVGVDMRPVGEVAVWTCSDQPELSTAALVCPERILHRMSQQGLPTADTRLVISPAGPFVSASGAAARRIADESGSEHVVAAWDQVEHIDWNLPA